MEKDSVLCEVGTESLRTIHSTMWNTVSLGNPKGVKNFANLLLYYIVVDTKMLLKWIFKKQNRARAWTGLMCLRIGTGRGFWGTQSWTSCYV